ncbi:PilZ domain-containing protein [Dechloromonas sp. HYN0024]|uniref:PilZ domain-containing protein n=1 Tax=Dechloromonas sp. HYN0024 TaxID=2231055 RepID=UPI000E449F45|nr:PilZ domain-containing protein [Dechloromonas sp. HYN0024]AXS80928.1 hypothetical protein HYN24_13395 [Dechloromonas sp. HYN0024]
MFPEEKRKQERHSFENPPEGALFLLSNGARLEVAGINDISNSGVSLGLDQPLVVAQQVTVGFADAAVCVQVRGTVTWCAPADDATKPGSFAVGIELTSPMLLLSMLKKH